MRTLILVSLAIVGLAFALPSHAETLRCGSKLISVGATKGEILAKCGEPDYVENIEEPVRARGLNGNVVTVGSTSREIWTYRRAPGKFPAVLTFDGSTLRSIEFIKS
jgi:hypothetical protein